MPEIAVVMSVYNGLPYLEEAVSSILNQTFRDFEFVIVDDASTDGSWELLETIAAGDGRIILLRNDLNSGASFSRNKGIARTTAGKIAFMDADDRSLPGRLQLQLDFLEGHPEVGFVGTLPVFIDYAGRPMDVPQYAFLTENADIQRQLPDSNCLRLGSVMVRRCLLTQVGLYDPELEPAEDYDLWLRMAEVTEVANLPERLYLYREHVASTSTGRRHVQVHQKGIALERALDRRYRRAVPQELMAFVARDFLRAGILACLAGDKDAARQNVEHALRTAPSMVESGDLIEREALACFSSQRTSDPAGLARTLFEQLLPKTRHVLRAQRKVIGSIHMQKVFELADDRKANDVGRHLWSGIAVDPSWLLNRGVWAIGTRLLLAKVLGQAQDQ